jgi:MAP3K TRAFs-binding domain
MELREPPDPRRAELLPVVTYSVKRRIESKPPDYWDYATLLELALLDNNEQKAMNALSSALAADPMGWQAQSTLDTVRRLGMARAARGMLPAWMTLLERDLEEAARTS